MVLSLCVWLLFSTAFGDTFTLSPQIVVSRVLEMNERATYVDLRVQQSYAELEGTKGQFDFQVFGTLGWAKDKEQNFDLTNNLEDRRRTYSLGAQQKFPTGTLLKVEWSEVFLESRLGSFNQSRQVEPVQNRNVVHAELRQSLVFNSFGLADRMAVQVARHTLDRDLAQREEDLEATVLEVLSLFWKTYTLQAQLKNSIEARDKYEKLSQSTKQKMNLNILKPGELPILLAEQALAEEKVKSSSEEFLSSLDQLLIELKLPLDTKVSFAITDPLPPIPKLSEKNIDGLRRLDVARNHVHAKELEARAARWASLPELDLVARYESIGLDRERDRSFSEMTAGRYPNSFVGVEFKTYLDSSTHRAREAQARIALEKARLESSLARMEAHFQLLSTERQVVALYHMAKSLLTAEGHRQKAVQELERAYRVGRVPLNDVVEAFSKYFNTQQEAAKVIANYQIALNKLAASRDELVTSKTEKPHETN